MESTICLATILLAITTLADQHYMHHGGSDGHGPRHIGAYDDNKYDMDRSGDFDMKAYKGGSDSDYSLRKNDDNGFGFDKHSQGSSKDAAARKHSKAATANKNHNKNFEKEQENKAASKNSHDKAAASASARNKERHAQASKKHAKKFSRAKNINIYSKKASDVTNSFEDNSASAKSSSKDTDAKKAASKDKGSNAALRSSEKELKQSDNGNSNAASTEQSNAAHVKTAANKNGLSGHKSSSSKGSHAYRKRASPSSFTKLSAPGQYGLGDLQHGSFGSYRGYPIGSISASNSYSTGTFSMKGEGSLPSSSFGIGSRAISGYTGGLGATSSSSGQSTPYSHPYRHGGATLGSSSNIYGAGRQPLGSNTFGIGGGHMPSIEGGMPMGSMTNIGGGMPTKIGGGMPMGSMTKIGGGMPMGSMTNIGGGMPMGSMTNIRVGRESYGRPLRGVQKSGLTVDSMGSGSRIGGQAGYGQKGATTRLSVDSFGSFGSDVFEDFEDDVDDDNLYNVDYGSSGFGDGW